MKGQKTTLLGEKDGDPDTDRGLFAKLAEDAILFVICCFLVRLGVCWLVSVRIPLIIIAATVGISIIACRIHEWRKNHDGY